MSNLLHVFLSWFDDTFVWKWFARRILSHLTFRVFGYPQFDFEKLPGLFNELAEGRSKINSVQAFVLADRMTLASILIRMVSKSKWSHAGWILHDSNGLPMAVHMKGSGMVVQSLYGLLRECDDFAVVRIPTSNREAILQKILDYSNRDTVRYDFEQELSDDASPLEVEDIYCSELIWLCAKDHADLKLSTVLGRKAFSPDDVARSGEIVWEYNPPKE